MSFKKILLSGWLGTILLFGGCAEWESPINPKDSVNNFSSQAVQLVLGKKLENPYSVSSILLARDNLVARGVLSKSAVADDDLTATHYYIRFKPDTDEQLIELKSDTSLVLWDYPLDYEILEGGSVYRDPDITADAPNCQYTSVRINQILPNVKYEILEELILVTDSDDLPLGKRSVLNYYNVLEYEALRITGNLPETEKGLAKAMSKWRPSGNIQVTDDILGRNVPVVTVNVRARNWFRWWDGYTDHNGNFRSSTEFTGGAVDYSLRWQYPNNRFDIRSGSLGQAFFNGPRQGSAWNLVISSGMSWTYAHIFRAGSYYCGAGRENFGFTNPPFKLISICAYDKNAPEAEAGHYNNANENVIMYRYNPIGELYTSKEIFSNTAHEFGHAHHDEVFTGGSVYSKVALRLMESWAVVVSYYMTSNNYSIPINTYDFWYTKQNFVSTYTTPYTPLMIDLIDTFNQRVMSNTYLNDAVFGYTLKQIEDIIKKGGCKSVTDFKNEIKALPLPTGLTATDRDNYLNQY